MVAKVKLTKTFVGAVRPIDQDVIYWDTRTVGFGLKVTPTGHKAYVARYRLPGHKQDNRQTIGVHGSPHTLETAREEALAILFDARKGKDPRAALKARRQTSDSLQFDKYADFFAEKYLAKNWPGSLDRAMSWIRRAKAHFRKKFLPDITKGDIVLWMDTMEEMPTTAHHAYNVVNKLFRWAEQRDDVQRNPMSGVPKPKAGPSRERFLSDDEIVLVWQATLAMDHPFAAVVRMLLLSGQRRGEVCGMTWEELDLANSEWLIPASRTKADRATSVPLTNMMEAEIADRPRLGKFVFTARGDKPLANFGMLKRKLDSFVAEQLEKQGRPVMETWTLHDLRRTAATGLQSLGVSFDLVERLQNRVPASGVGMRYQRHDFASEKREAMERWTNHLAALVTVEERAAA